MTTAAAPAPAAAPAKKSYFKTIAGAMLGLFSGAAAMYATAVFNTVVKPNPPVANFAVSTDGLNATCQNHAVGTGGWWDYGDGSPLEAYDPGKPNVTHTYTKPGSYSIKLIVRNFLMEESERSVPVDLTTPPQTQAPPTVSDFTVEAIGSQSVAPAAFRIRGKAENTERVILDLGDRVEVNTDTGTFERLVVFEKPGQYPIQLIGHTGKQAVKQSAMVTVTAPKSGTLSVLLKVTDAGARVEKQTFTEIVPITAPTKGTKTIERVIPARAGFNIVQASIGKVTSSAIQNLKVAVAADKRTAKITGEWTGSGTEAMVPVIINGEKTTAIAMAPESLAAAFPPSGLPTIKLPLPPQPRNVAGVQRKMSLEFREASADGTSRVLLTVADLKVPYSGTVMPVRGTSGPQPVSAQLVGDSVVVKWGN